MIPPFASGHYAAYTTIFSEKGARMERICFNLSIKSSPGFFLVSGSGMFMFYFTFSPNIVLRFLSCYPFFFFSSTLLGIPGAHVSFLFSRTEYAS